MKKKKIDVLARLSDVTKMRRNVRDQTNQRKLASWEVAIVRIINVNARSMMKMVDA